MFPKPKYVSLGNEIYDRNGMHVLSISYAIHGDLKAAANRVCRLLCMEDAMRGFKQQGIDGLRDGPIQGG